MRSFAPLYRLLSFRSKEAYAQQNLFAYGISDFYKFNQ
jgi:hypothetical protein